MQQRCARHAGSRCGTIVAAYNSRLVNARQFGWKHTTSRLIARNQLNAAAPIAPEEIPHAELVDNLFQDLCSHCGIKSHVKVGESNTGGVGLFATQALDKGGTIISVPRSLCIVLDNATGSLSIPQGEWPRLSGGIMQQGEPLTWDVLEALALMDATAGDGDPFWELYSEHFLQQPEQLTLPMCWEDELMQQLQHAAIIDAAKQQQARLKATLPPEYMQPIEPGLPSYLQWGFACVRSRALQLGPQAFGMVPFIDIANHAADPNADTHVPAAAVGASSKSNGSTGEVQDLGSNPGVVHLVAVKPVAAGEEVTISYSGLTGYTNQRFMAQYGFVPSNGNTADRLEFQIPEKLQGCRLRLSYLEEALGAQLLLAAAQGKNPYLIAALKSLPVTADEPDTAAAAAAANDSSSCSNGRGIGPATQQEQHLAAALLEQLNEQLAACSSSLQADEQLLQQLQQQGGDVRLIAAVRYRVERKRLLQQCRVLLNIFLRE